MRYYLFIYLLRYLFWFFIFWRQVFIFRAVLLLTLCQCAALRCYISWVCIIIKPSLYILNQRLHLIYLQWLKNFNSVCFGGAVVPNVDVSESYKWREDTSNERQRTVTHVTVENLCSINSSDNRTDKSFSFSCCRPSQLPGRVHVLPFVFQDLSGGEGQVFIADVTVINSVESGDRRRASWLLFIRPWKHPQSNYYSLSTLYQH